MPSPSAASVAQNKTKTPPPQPNIITLYGHISGEKDNLIKLKIDWLEQVIDLKYAIKEANERVLNYLAANQLVVYKLDIENKDDNGYSGLENGWTLNQYPTEAWSRLKLKNTDYLHKLWSDGPTNEMDRIHFLVVLPDQKPSSMASHSPSTASVVQNETTPRPPPKIITLFGHISGEKENLIKLKIDWLEQVIDLKYAIKEANEPDLNYLAAEELVVYKLDIENTDDNGYVGLEVKSSHL
ncbi:hypothetical protein C0993_000175 [Termitomyces sp. T159_Od127]|nr:hypothetical protein C0993_000175 [Termitomyces sp. T159_Od127]